LCENKRAAAFGTAALIFFQVNPSKTPSGSPRAQEYYDAEYAKQAAGQRLMVHKKPFEF